MADFTKTGTQVDEWAVVGPATLREGATFAIADDLRIRADVTVCKGEATAHDGNGYVIVEGSWNTTGDEDWTELISFMITAETAVGTTLDVEASATDTLVPLTATTDMETKGDRYFIKNGTIGNSEVVRNNGNSSGVSITILDGLTNTQANATPIFTGVEDFSFGFPAEYRRGRILIKNLDADCDIVTRTTIAKVTDIE